MGVTIFFFQFRAQVKVFRRVGGGCLYSLALPAPELSVLLQPMNTMHVKKLTAADVIFFIFSVDWVMNRLVDYTAARPD